MDCEASQVGGHKRTGPKGGGKVGVGRPARICCVPTVKSKNRADEICGMKLFCDYSLVGRSMEFPVIVTKLEREELRVGSLVCITGDGIPDRQGVVVRLASNSVVVRMDEA
jgi:hypothetical protein